MSRDDDYGKGESKRLAKIPYELAWRGTLPKEYPEDAEAVVDIYKDIKDVLKVSPECYVEIFGSRSTRVLGFKEFEDLAKKAGYVEEEKVTFTVPSLLSTGYSVSAEDVMKTGEEGAPIGFSRVWAGTHISKVPKEVLDLPTVGESITDFMDIKPKDEPKRIRTLKERDEDIVKRVPEAIRQFGQKAVDDKEILFSYEETRKGHIFIGYHKKETLDKAPETKDDVKRTHLTNDEVKGLCDKVRARITLNCSGDDISEMFQEALLEFWESKEGDRAALSQVEEDIRVAHKERGERADEARKLWVAGAKVSISFNPRKSSMDDFLYRTANDYGTKVRENPVVAQPPINIMETPDIKRPKEMSGEWVIPEEECKTGWVHLGMRNKGSNQDTTSVDLEKQTLNKQQEEINMTNSTSSYALRDNTRRVVNIQLIDDDSGLDVSQSLVASFEGIATEDDNATTIQQLMMDKNVKAELEKHNEARVKVVNKDILNRTGQEVKLQPIKIKDLRWVVQ